MSMSHPASSVRASQRRPHRRHRLPAFVAAAAAAAAAFSASARAASFYWDSNGSTGGAGATPTGTWGSDAFWNDLSDGTGNSTAWTSGSVAVFSAGADASGPYTVTLSGPQAVEQLVFEDGAPTLSGAGSLTLGATGVDVSFGVTASIDSTINGVAGLTKINTGTLALSTANGYSGTTFLNAGVVSITNDNNLGLVTNNIDFGGGTLRTTNSITSARNINFTGAGVIDTNGVDSTFSGQFSGAGNFTKTGAGTLELSGDNVAGGFLGAITANLGTVRATSGNVFGIAGTAGLASAVQVNSGGALEVASGFTVPDRIFLNGTGVSNGGAIHKTGSGDTTFAGGISLNGASRIVADAGNVVFSSGAWFNPGAASDVTLAGGGNYTSNVNISIGAGRVIKEGSGTLTLTANSAFTGGITIKGGVVSIPAESSAVGGTSSPPGAVPIGVVANYITLDGGTLRSTNADPSGTTSFIIPNRGITLAGGGGTLDVSDPAARIVYAGKITGAGALQKVGPGTLILSGTSDYVGTTTISGGTVQTGGGTTAYFGSTSNTIKLDGGTLKLSAITNGATFLNTAYTISLTANGGTISVDDAPGNPGNPANPWADSTTLPNSGVTAQSTNFQGMLSGPGTLYKTGKGEFRSQRTGAGWTNTRLEVQSGFFKAQNSGTGGADTAFGAVPTSGVDPLAIFANGAGTDRASGGAALGVGASMTTPVNRGITISANGVTIITGAVWTIQSAITGAGGLTLNENGWNPTAVTGTAANGQALVLQGVNTFQGPVKINDAILELQNGAAIPDTTAITIASASSNTAPVENQAVLKVTNDETIGSLAGGGGTGVGAVGYGWVLASGQLSTGANNTSTTYSGQITGSGGLTKVGNGTMTIKGFDYTNTGPVNINGGTLLFGDANAGLGNASAVSVGAAGTLDMATTNDTIGSLAGAGSVRGSGNLIVAGNNVSPVTYSGNYTGSGSFTKQGVSTQNLAGNNTFAAITVSDGVLGVQSSGALGAGAAPLDVQNSAKVTFLPTGTGTIAAKIGNLTMGPSAKIDLGDDKLITTAAIGTWDGVSSYTGVTGLIKTGRNGGGWGGNGIVTSQTSATTSNFTSIGIAKGVDVRPNTATETALWAGRQVTGTDTLVMYTYGGDANLDGKINVDDYGRIDFNINLGTTGWSNGDFNYDGIINVDDYGIIDFNVGIQGTPFFTAGGVANASGLSGVSAVPEPATLSVLGVASAAILARRRRRVG